MPNKVLLKKSSVAAKVPLTTDLDYGELALNYTDEKLYFKNASNAIKSFTAPNNGTLTLGVSGTGLSGSASFSADQAGNSSFTVSSNATDLNTASTLVARDASGNFAAGTIAAALSGNATTATTLQTARNINGTSFNGSTDITTANWGTARTITIGATGKSVNGSANVSWTLGEIQAEYQQPINTIRGNLGDPTVREMALFHGQFNNKFRFIAPTTQEESTDGVVWTASTRATANQLADMMIGEGQGTSFSAIPSATIGVYGAYRLTWDVVGQTGYVFLNNLYLYNSTSGNNVTVLIEALHNTNGWTTITGPHTFNNWPGHTTVPHSTIPYSASATQYSKVRVTFTTTHNTNTNAFTLYGIEWFGGYPAGRRNAESYDRDKNVYFPNGIFSNGNAVLNASNYNTYAPTLTGTGASGTWGISITGTAGGVDWANVSNKPDPVVTVTLTGDVTGTANTTLTDLASGTVSIATTVAANSVALGTDTTGDYVVGLTAGTGISITGTAGEGWSPTVTNTAPNVTTDISITHNASTVVVVSSDGADGTINAATTLLAGVLSSADKTKLDGIAAGAEVNQNTFSNVAVSGQTTVAADAKSDTLTLVAGSNVTITTDAVADSITIASATPGDGTLSIATKTAGATNTDVTLNLSGAYSANTTTNRTINAVVGPALTALASTMTGAGTGFLRKNGADTYTVDTNTYLTAESDTLATVTGRGNSTSTNIGSTSGTALNFVTAGNVGTWIGGIQDGTSGWSLSQATIGFKSDNATYAAIGIATAGGLLYFGRTTASGVGTMSSWLEVNSGGVANFKLARPQHNGSNLALVSELPTVGSGALAVSIGTAGATNTTVTWGTSTGFNANTGTSYTYDLKVGPALTNLATLMSTAGAGFIRRGATADTYTIDTNTYLTAEADTLATVTGRGATTTVGISINNVTNGVINQFDGNASQWYGRILVKNATSDRSAFLGSYAGIAGVFAHNNALSAWAPLYINTVSGAAEGSDVFIAGSGRVGVGTTTVNAKFVVNGGTVNTTTYTSSEARISDGTIHLMKTVAGGVFEAVRAINNDVTVGTTVRVLGAATSDPFNNANGGKVFIDAIRTATNMDLAFLLNDVAGAAAVERVRFMGSGNVGIGTSNPGYKLEVNGSFAATTKSFVINHPTKPGKKLRYGSLEGPENGVYVRGKLKGTNVIELPDYWTKLVDPESITVNLTPIGKHQNLYVEEIIDNKVVIVNGNLLNKEINCYYTIFAERIDVDKLEVEIE